MERDMDFRDYFRSLSISRVLHHLETKFSQLYACFWGQAWQWF